MVSIVIVIYAEIYFISVVPTGPPQSVVAQVVSPTVFTLTWSPPLPEHRNGIIQYYIISIMELETTTTELFNTTEENITVTGQHPFYRYSCTVAAVTIAEGPYSVPSTVHLPEAGMSTSVFEDNVFMHFFWQLHRLLQMESSLVQ